MTRLSEHFTVEEFKCRDGSYKPIDKELILKLEVLRSLIGRPINVNSGYRSPAYNKRIGGATKSQHMLGKAADIHVDGMEPEELYAIAEEIGFGGIGLYDTFVHLDVRAKRTRWDLRKDKSRPVKEADDVKVATVRVDGEDVKGCILINGLTYLPARPVAELLNADIAYDAEKKIVDITRKKG